MLHIIEYLGGDIMKGGLKHNIYVKKGAGIYISTKRPFLEELTHVESLYIRPSGALQVITTADRHWEAASLRHWKKLEITCDGLYRALLELAEEGGE